MKKFGWLLVAVTVAGAFASATDADAQGKGSSGYKSYKGGKQLTGILFGIKVTDIESSNTTLLSWVSPGHGEQRAISRESSILVVTNGSPSPRMLTGARS